MLELEPLATANRNLIDYEHGLTFYATNQSNHLATAAARSRKTIANFYESENCRYTFLDITGQLVNYKISVSVLQLFFYILIKFAELNPLATSEEKETRLLTRQPITRFSLSLKDYLKDKTRKNITDFRTKAGQDCAVLAGLGVNLFYKTRERGKRTFKETTTGRLNFFQYIHYNIEHDRIDIIISDPYAYIMLMDGEATNLTADFFTTALSDSHNSISLLLAFLRLANEHKRTEAVSSLLNFTNLPSYEETKEKNRDYKNKIIKPFLTALENIDSFNFSFRQPGQRVAIPKEEIAKTDIETFLKLRLYFTQKQKTVKNFNEQSQELIAAIYNNNYFSMLE